MIKTIIHTVFEETVKRFPNKIAIEESNGKHITYDVVNRTANRLAYALREKGCRSETVIGLFQPQGIDYVISLLGIAKTGGIFLPLDIDSPANRLKNILLKSAPTFIIVGEEQTAALNNVLAKADLSKQITVLSLSEVKEFPETNPELLSEPDDGNYIIFTSGSTGEPKAILGCHKGLSHFIHWEIKEFCLDERIKVSQLAPPTFDVSLRDILVPLLAGGTLCIPSTPDRTSTGRLLHWLQKSQITLMHCVPSLFRLLIKEIEQLETPDLALPAMEKILLAGEPLYGNDVLKWRSLIGERIELVNLYGPSETTLAKAFNRIKEPPREPGKIIPIGQPIANTALLIFKNNELCEKNEIGEIHIKTPFMSKGYYRDPELTAINFIQNPLNPNVKDIIYKTGDLGRYLSDRSVELLGRQDNQVKVNGIRIELAEIEKDVLRHDAVEQTVIVAHQTTHHDSHLTCYYVANREIDTHELREYLRSWLPDYMIPAFFVQLDQFPLNLHGKIDRSALPKPEDLLYQHVEYEAPKNEIEKQLVAIWGEVLGLKKIGINNTFIDLGGDSLKAIRTISRIYQTFGFQISFQQLFPNATVQKLATQIYHNETIETKNSRSEFADIQPVENLPKPNIEVSPTDITKATAEELAMLAE